MIEACVAHPSVRCQCGSFQTNLAVEVMPFFSANVIKAVLFNCWKWDSLAGVSLLRRCGNLGDMSEGATVRAALAPCLFGSYHAALSVHLILIDYFNSYHNGLFHAPMPFYSHAAVMRYNWFAMHTFSVCLSVQRAKKGFIVFSLVAFSSLLYFRFC